jgi:uncharacterized protein (DUF58 family)
MAPRLAPQYGPLLDALRGVKWPARRTAAGWLVGAQPSRRRGSAPELEEYRVYRQGDDPRRIDWRLLARSDRAYVRLAPDHTTLPTLLVVDASASMAFPPETLDKWAAARAIAVGLAAAAHAGGDPVGITVIGGVVRSLAPTARRGAVAEIARLVDAPPSGHAGLAAALDTSSASRMAVVSDFLDDAESDTLSRAARARIAAGAEVHVVHVVARAELNPETNVTAVDPEAPALRRSLTSSTREAYAERFAAWREGVAHVWRSAGAWYTQAVTDEPPEHAVRRIVRPRDAARGAR